MSKTIKRMGFTLIELLVVIAIIALLLGILVPGLNKAKMIAQTLICGTNLKNYGPALQMYATDNHDKAPFMRTWLFSQTTLDSAAASDVVAGCMWHNDRDYADGSMWPYLSKKDVHLCPVFKNYATRMGADECPNVKYHGKQTPFGPTYSYSMNWFLGFDWERLLVVGNDGMFARQISMKIPTVKTPGKCFAFSEENLWPITYRAADIERSMVYSRNVLNDNALWMNANKTKLTEATDNFATYHNVNASKKDEGKANVIFVDGHVELVLGAAGREAYLQFARPYPGHENMNVW